METRIHDLLLQLDSSDSNLCVEATRCLLESGVAGVTAFCDLFCIPSTSRSDHAAKALRVLGPAAVAPLVQVLQTATPEAQVYALVGLFMLKEPSALPPLLEALKSPHAEVRKKAIDAIWILRDLRAVEPLIPLLLDEDVNVAGAAASGLGWLEDRRAVAPLLVALQSRKWYLRACAVSALGEIGDETTLAVVRRCLADPMSKVRRFAKGALARFDSRRREKL